jgi:iron(III) transport system substrate-binding protein
VLYADKSQPLTSFRYEDLANPKWKGKVCIRAGQHPYNTALIAAMIAHDGEAKTEQWLRGVKANLARKATGGDRDVARDILGGICDIGLANSYYVGQMKSSKPGTDARKWGDAINVVKPTFAGAKNSGTHVNISGAAVAKNAPQRANAVKLLEFLVSEPAQVLYAQANYEYPVRKGVALDPIIGETIGDLKADPLPLTEIAKYRKQASALVDKVGFDQ